MTARVFISYRTSDGADKATALARDLDALFGNSQVFLDKEDLPAGSRWRDAISQAISGCPILLVLVTPNYLGARDADGRRCIEHADDPARDELETAIAAKAQIIPLLCDGVTATPSAADLPKPFDQLAELQWGHLRAFDWHEDLGRLAADLLRLGVTAAGPTPMPPLTQPATMPAPLTQPATQPVPFAQPVTTPMPLYGAVTNADDREAATAPGRRLALGAGALLLLLVVGGWGAWRWRRRHTADLSGRWRVRIGALGAPSARDGGAMFITLEQAGQKLALASSAVDIEREPDWQDYRDFWRQRNGTELKRVFYRGEGKVLGEDEEDEDSEGEPASAAGGGAVADRAAPSARPLPTHRIAIAIQIFAPGGRQAIDGGALRGTVDPDAQRIHARLWLNSEQAERVVELRRGG